MDKLIRLGFNSWFQEKIDLESLKSHEIARVVSVRKDSYMVNKGGADIFAELSGRLIYSASSAADYPTTGDWVYVDFYDEDEHAIIHDVVPRKTIIQRKTAGKTIDYQLIASNVDVAFVIQSVDYNFNLNRLERYLVMLNEVKITPVILLSKCDLKSTNELNDIVESIKSIALESTVIPFSSVSGLNIDAIKAELLSGHTYCLLGSSGVGKTTLLNSLIGKDLYETKEVSSKENKGRHTTTSRELLQLESGAILIDTPGMRELGNISVDRGLDETFSEIIELSKNCKYSNCTHINEKGCAILSAIEKGDLSEKRYKNYIKMKKESSFNEMSYFEKKQKDKKFGKLVKSVMAGKRDKRA